MPLGPWLGMAATSLVAALLLATNGFGFAVLAVPLFLQFAPADQAIPIAIILSLLILLTVLPGLCRRVEGPLLLRLTIGSLFGLPLGLAAFAHAEPRILRGAAGAVITVFAVAQAYNHYHRRPPSLTMRPLGDVVAGAIAGAATGLVGMPGPPVVIYLIAVGAPVQMGRATQMAFFTLVFAATLAADAALHGVPGRDWVIAASLMPTTAIGALIGMRVANRLNENSATILAIAVLGAAGLYTLAAAVGPALW
jgi:uncharacterized protein